MVRTETSIDDAGVRDETGEQCPRTAHLPLPVVKAPSLGPLRADVPSYNAFHGDDTLRNPTLAVRSNPLQSAPGSDYRKAFLQRQTLLRAGGAATYTRIDPRLPAEAR